MCGCSKRDKSPKSFVRSNESSEILHNGTLPTHQGIKCNALFDSHNESTKAGSEKRPADMDPNSDTKKNDSTQPRPSPSPRFHRLKPTSIRKQRTLEDGHFHERKPLMSRTNYLDDSNITLSSFRSSSTNNLKEMKEDTVDGKPISTLSMVKKKKKLQKANKGGNISSRDVDVRAITKFYMSNTSQKHKNGREAKNGQDNIDDSKNTNKNSITLEGKFYFHSLKYIFNEVSETNSIRFTQYDLY